MIKIGVLPFNPFQENTIVVSDETGECIIVDAGNYNAQENAALSKYISDNGLKPVMAVNTHGHVDHMLGVNASAGPTCRAAITAGSCAASSTN